MRWLPPAGLFKALSLAPPHSTVVCHTAAALATCTAGNLPIYMRAAKADPGQGYSQALHTLRWIMVMVEVARQHLRGVKNEATLAHLVRHCGPLGAAARAGDAAEGAVTAALPAQARPLAVPQAPHHLVPPPPCPRPPNSQSPATGG